MPHFSVSHSFSLYRTPTFNVLVLIASVLSAIDLHAQPSHLTFEQISTAQDLSQDIVTAILQDSEGFMWFGTEDGLNRYDGYAIKVYKHDARDPATISHNNISVLYEDRQQRLWVGTGNGLDRFDREHEAFVHFRHDPDNPRSISNNGMGGICEDRQGNLCVGTGNGLNRYDEHANAFAHYFHNPGDSTSINANAIGSLMLDRAGMLWIATANGFCRFDEQGNRFIRHLYTANPTATSYVGSLHEDHNGIIWFSRGVQGVWHLDITRQRLEPLPLKRRPGQPTTPDVLANPVASGIAEDAKGNLWIGHFGGLDVYDPKAQRFLHVVANPGEPGALRGRVGPIRRDRAGVMWLGTFQGGVNRCDPNRQKFMLYRNDPNDSNSLGGNSVSGVYEDKAGDVWIGTDNGLDRLDRKTHTFTHYRHSPENPHSLSSPVVNAILEDHEGNLWIGGPGNPLCGLDRLDRRTDRFIHYPIASVKAIFESRDHVLWIGKLNELDIGEDMVRLDRDANIIARDTIPGTGVWCLYEDREGFMWSSGQYCCLNKFDKRSASFMPIQADGNDPGKLSSGGVRAIYEDDDGYLWLGTWGGGLDRYDRRSDTFTRFLERDGLPSDYVKGLLPDDHGNLWIATERGLSRFNMKSHSFRNFTATDGLQGDRFLSGSCFKGKNGWMYFGGTNGLNAFHPDSIRDNPNIPPVVITTFRVLDKPAALPGQGSPIKEIHLTYDQDFFSFEFVALDYTAPHMNQYAYMLEGLDRDWIHAGTRRYAAYTHLSPGVYIFRVRGSNNDGVWNNEGASIRIVIAPPFWRTWWFTFLVVLTVAGMLYLAYRYRINQVLAIERLRSRIAADLHDDVGSNLSSIALASQLISRRLLLPENERAQLDEIGATALQTSDMMKEIVWLLNPRNDSLDDLLLKMKTTAASMLRGMEYTFNGPVEKLSTRVDLATKRNLFLMYKEMLSNAVKHSHATAIAIDVAWSKGTFQLKVHDNGRGFDRATITPGNGLANLKARSEQIKGMLNIESGPAHGTTITISAEIT